MKNILGLGIKIDKNALTFKDAKECLKQANKKLSKTEKKFKICIVDNNPIIYKDMPDYYKNMMIGQIIQKKNLNVEDFINRYLSEENKTFIDLMVILSEYILKRTPGKLVDGLDVQFFYLDEFV